MAVHDQLGEDGFAITPIFSALSEALRERLSVLAVVFINLCEECQELDIVPEWVQKSVFTCAVVAAAVFLEVLARK